MYVKTHYQVLTIVMINDNYYLHDYWCERKESGEREKKESGERGERKERGERSGERGERERRGI